MLHRPVETADKSGPENLLLSNTLDHSVRTYEHNSTYENVVHTIPLETIPILKYVFKTFLNNPVDFLILYLKYGPSFHLSI